MHESLKYQNLHYGRAKTLISDFTTNRFCREMFLYLYCDLMNVLLINTDLFQWHNLAVYQRWHMPARTCQTCAFLLTCTIKYKDSHGLVIGTWRRSQKIDKLVGSASRKTRKAFPPLISCVRAAKFEAASSEYRTVSRSVSILESDPRMTDEPSRPPDNDQTSNPLVTRGKKRKLRSRASGVEVRPRGGSTCERRSAGCSRSPNLVILGFLRKSFISQP